MPKLNVYATERKITTDFTTAFARGAMRDTSWEVNHYPISDFLQNGLKQLTPGIDAVATLGILRGTGLLIKEAIRLGIDYYYMDHAYFNPGYSGKGWMRIVKNGHSCHEIRNPNKDRWKTFFKSSNLCEPWLLNHQRGHKIIICPPTHAVAWFQNLNYDWGLMVENKLKEMLPTEEHSRIIIRKKPKEPIVDEMGNLIRLEITQNKTSLSEDLKNACCVISYNSMVSLQATLLGIPVITEDISCCNPISFKLGCFEKSAYPDEFNTEPDRATLLYSLSNNQWQMKEIERGIAWNMLQENYND